MYTSNYPPTPKNQYITIKKHRDSNLELYRVIIMLLIVAHHYVANSGLIDILKESPINPTSNLMLLFGAWGKTGINCFVLITGFFMCKSTFTWEKIIKLYLQILFYTLIIYGIFCITGHEKLSIFTLIWKIFPIKSISSGFISCFLLFYLFIPFINILLQHINKRQHKYLIILFLLIYSIIPSIPKIFLSFNYISWFVAVYIIAAYLRSYGEHFKFKHKQWGILAILSILIGSVSVIGMSSLYKLGYISQFQPYFFISDSNKFLSILIAVSSFMWFKGLKIKNSSLINAMGATTFGVLLIHANSDAMRQWLWKETVDCIGHFEPSLLITFTYASLQVLIIFIICSSIEWFRQRYFEPFCLNIIHNIKYNKKITNQF